MINQLIRSLRSSKNFRNRFKSDEINYVLLTSGGYRKYDKNRLVVIIFDSSEPRLVVKFYKNTNSISNEFKIQTQIYDIYGDLITKPLGLECLDDYELFIEEPILGKNLTRYVYENLNQNSLLEIFKLVFTFYKNLNFHVETSNIQNFTKEIDFIFQTFNSNFKISNSHIDMIKNLKLEFIKNFENKKIYQRFSNDDFILNNFIINDNKITLTDFEFSKKTHFYFFDWFQFFKYQWIISNDYLHDLTISKISDNFFNLGLKEFSNYRANEKFELACRLIYEISDFNKRFNISSASTCKLLIQDMEKLLDDLDLRYKNPNVILKESNLESSEKEFFKGEHDKLIDYKKNTDELIYLRQSIVDLKFKIDEHFQKIQFFKQAIKDKDAYLDQAIKDKEEYLNHVIKDYKAVIYKIKNSKSWKILHIFDKNKD